MKTIWRIWGAYRPQTMEGKTVEGKTVEDERYGMWARVLQPGDIMRLALDEAFSESLQDDKPMVRATFLDKGKGSIKVSATGMTVTTSCTDSGKWRTANIRIDGAKIANMYKGGRLSIEAVDEPATLPFAPPTFS